MSAAPDVFVRQKATAEDWTHADRIEVIGGDKLPNESFSAIASGECGARDLADEECAERRRGTREVHEVRPRHLDRGEDWRANQHANAELKILAEPLEPEPAPDLA